MDRRLTALSLRRLAPTVLTTPLTATRMLELLRAAGYAPVPEDASGAAVLSRPTAARGPARPAPRGGRLEDFVGRSSRRPGWPASSSRSASATASPGPPAALRSPGPWSTPTGRHSSQAHTAALAVLRQALQDQARVWVGYVDAHGELASKLVRPVSIGAGYLRAEDDRSEMLHTFALHRITSAVLDAPTPPRA